MLLRNVFMLHGGVYPGVWLSLFCSRPQLFVLLLLLLKFELNAHWSF